MPEKTLFSSPPRGLLLFFLRAPIFLYRIGLGFLLGERFVLLNHIGRKSGQTHRTVVEVVGHDRETDTYYIVSGWGYKSNWYRNLQAHPDIAVEVGRRKLDIHAETLPAAAGADVLLDYQQKHPVAARELSNLMGLNIASGTKDELTEAIQAGLPVVALQKRLSGE